MTTPAGSAPGAKSPWQRASTPLLVAAGTVLLGFSGGGFFAGTTGRAAVVGALVVAVWATVAARPLARLTVPLVVASAALALFAVWILASSGWSGASARSLVEFDRALLYLAVVLFGGLALSDAQGRRGALEGLALGSTLVCAAGLLSRVLPDLWPTSASIEAERLAYPVTYWNALGLLAVVGIVVALHLCAWEREPRAVRVAAAGAVPLLAATLYFTFSRGPMIMLPVGVVAYFALGRPRGAAGALLATVPATAAVLVAAYGADALSSDHPSSAAAVHEGHRVAAVIGGAVLVAVVVRLLTLRLDRRSEERRARRRVSTRTATAAGAAVLAVVVIGAVTSGATGWASDQYTRFVKGDVIEKSGDQRARLLNVGNNGRLDHWRVSLDAFRRAPLHGSGAATYELEWARERPTQLTVVDGHSLYMETLGELGLVGLVLVLTGVLTLVVTAPRRAGGPDRAVGAAATAVVAVWALHAGIDWDWEMPAVTAPALLVGATMLGSATARVPDVVAAPPRTARVLAGLGCLLLAVTPALVAISQTRLDDAVAAFRRGDCASAVPRALGASSVLRVRPEPLEVIGLCDARAGQGRLAVDAIAAARRRDPHSWQLMYELALVRAADGQDPRTAARAARAMNPLSPLTRDAVERFATSDPSQWRRRARTARLPI